MGFFINLLIQLNILPDPRTKTRTKPKSKEEFKQPEYVKTYFYKGRRTKVISANKIELYDHTNEKKNTQQEYILKRKKDGRMVLEIISNQVELAEGSK